MKILLVNYRYFISGGPEKYMFNIKRKLEEEGHEVIPFSINSNKNEPSEYSKYFVEPIGGRNVTYYNEYKKTPKTILKMLSRSIYSFEVKKAIKKIIKDTNPDVVYILHYVNKLSPSVIRGAKEMHKVVVLRLSDYFLLCPRFDFLYNKNVCEDCLTKGYRSCIKKRCVKNSLFASVVRTFSMKFHKFIKIYNDIDVIVTTTNFMREKLIQNGFEKSKIFCIPTFTTRVETKADNIGKYGLYIGRITEEKGVEYLIKAYEKLPEYQLKIAADNTTDEAKLLMKYVQNKNMSNIEFTGFKRRKELDDLIENSRFVLIPSIWYENLPNTALEAFAHGKPVLASRIGSITELIKDEYNGYLFKPKDSNDIIEQVKKLDQDYKVLELGKNAKYLADNVYTEEFHYKLLIEALKNNKPKLSALEIRENKVEDLTIDLKIE